MSLSSRLRRHPFPVEAHFDRAVALSFAFPEAAVRPLVPASLMLDVHEGWAFVTIAMVWTRDLRPAGVPIVFGQSFFLAGYRVFTRLQEPSGRRLRGLRILRSDTDQRRMVWAGNLMTGYHYRHVAVHVSESGGRTNVRTTDGDGIVTLDITFSASGGDVRLPAGSPFRDWSEARRFSGPMPFTFSPEDDSTIIVVEGRRQHWEPRPITVESWSVKLFDEPPLGGAPPRLANAFIVEDIDYHWKRGRILKLPGAIG